MSSEHIPSNIVGTILLCLTRFQQSIPGLDAASWFYFELGVFMALNGLSLAGTFFSLPIRRRLRRLDIADYSCSAGRWANADRNLCFPFWVFSGVLTTVNMAYCYVPRGWSRELCSTYEDTSFFLYIIHLFYLGLVWTLLSRIAMNLFEGENIASVTFVDAHPIISLLLFFAKVAIAAALSVLMFRAQSRFALRLIEIMCGR